MSRRWRMVHGNTHSQGAEEAEVRGEMPITRAVDTVYTSLECKRYKVSRRKVKEFLEANCDCGWHHVAGPNGVQKVAYFSTELNASQKVDLLGLAEKEPPPAV